MIALRLLPTWAKLGGGALLAGGALLIAKKLTPEHPRIRVVKAAASQLGVQNADKYWALVNPGLVGSGKAWCGGFALWALKQAGLAANQEPLAGRHCLLRPALPTPRHRDCQ